MVGYVKHFSYKVRDGESTHPFPFPFTKGARSKGGYEVSEAKGMEKIKDLALVSLVLSHLQSIRSKRSKKGNRSPNEGQLCKKGNRSPNEGRDAHLRCARSKAMQEGK